MWSFLSSRKTSQLGIDIGTSSIKVVEIAKPESAKTKASLRNYGILSSPTYVNHKTANLIKGAGVALLESQVVLMMQALLEKFGNYPSQVVMSLPAFSSFVDEVILPPMPSEEIASAIAFEARSHVPVPISEVELTWQITSTNDKGSVATIIAVPKEIIFRYRSICAQLKLSLKALELETFSLIRSLNLAEEEHIVLLDLGARNTNVALIQKGLLRVSHNIETSGRDITNIIARGLGVSVDRAEQIKFDEGLGANQSNKAINDSLYSAVDTIADEVRRILETKGVRAQVKRLVLTGGSASMKGLPEYLQKKLGIPIDIVSPWATIDYNPQLEQILKNKSENLAVAIGLGLY